MEIDLNLLQKRGMVMKKEITIVVFTFLCSLLLAFGAEGYFLMNLLSNFCFIVLVLLAGEAIHKQIEKYKWNWIMVFSACILLLNLYLLFFADKKDRMVLVLIELAFVLFSILISVVKLILKKHSQNEWLSNLSIMILLLLLVIALDRIINVVPALTMFYVDITHIFLVMALWLVIRNFLVVSERPLEVKI